MRRVEIHLNGPNNWAGRRRVVVVREGPTEVLLLQPELGLRLTIRRSAFEAARPKSVPQRPNFVRDQIETVEKVRAATMPNITFAVLAYVKKNINPRFRMLTREIIG